MKNPWRTAICALLLCGAFALGCLPAQAAVAAPAMAAAPATEAAAVPAEITWPAHYRMYRRGLDGALEQAPGLFSGAYVQERTAALTDCAQRAAPRLRERAQCVGEQEVAGRTGLVYTWRAQSASGDYSLSDGAGDFLCTDFATQDVALPLSLEGQTA